MATIPDPISPNATNPSLCGVCPNLSTITCTGCDNMKYCSAACQQRDSAQHSTLCSTFKDFQQHPSPNHFRSIYFPVDESCPRFIWLRTLGSRSFHVVDIDDLSQYVPGQSYGGIMTSTHHGIKPEREYTSLMVVEYDQNMFDNCQPVNNCLLDLIGPVAQRWRGGIIRVVPEIHDHAR